MCQGRSDPDLITTLIDTSYDTMAWMQGHGVRWELVVDKLFDPAKIPAGETYAVPPGGAVRATNEGIGLMYDLFNAVEREGIEVRYDAPRTLSADVPVPGAAITSFAIGGTLAPCLHVFRRFLGCALQSPSKQALARTKLSQFTTSLPCSRLRRFALGLVRANNEDSFLVDDEHGFVARSNCCGRCAHGESSVYVLF